MVVVPRGVITRGNSLASRLAGPMSHETSPDIFSFFMLKLSMNHILLFCFLEGCFFHCTPLFHYPCPLGYWDVTSHDFFDVRAIAGFGAFSRYCCGGACG